jgi:2-keto-4-pentenoate hydratase
MQSREVRRAASIFIDAGRERNWIAAIPGALQPQTIEEAYAVQDAIVEMSGRTACGWKVGCTSRQTQTLLGADQPIAGRVFKDRMHKCPAVLAGIRDDMPLVEAEFAFTFATDLPREGAPFDRETVLAAVGQLLPAFELVESRLENWSAPKLLEVIADNASHGALALGDAIEHWRELNLPEVGVTLRVGEQIIAEGKGDRVLGNPVEALVWLANFAARRGLDVRAGEVVTTGTCIGAPTVPLGVPIVADFAGLGSITLMLSAT